MKCAAVLNESFAVAERPEWVDLVREESGKFHVNRRCDAEAIGGNFCPAHAGSAAGSDISKRIKLQIYVSPQVAKEFSIYETHEPDMRSRNERQVPQSLRRSTKVVDADRVDVSTLVSELKGGGWYVYRLHTGRKQTGSVVELSMAQRGYSKPPAAMSKQAMEAISDLLTWSAKVRVYRNIGYVHAEHGDIGLHSVEIVRTKVGEDCTSRLRFFNGLWTLGPLIERPAEEPVTAEPAATA